MPDPNEPIGPDQGNRGLADQVRFYDRRYAGYYMEETSSLEALKVKETLKVLPSDLSRILDFGCGQERLTGLLGEAFKEARGTEKPGSGCFCSCPPAPISRRKLATNPSERLHQLDFPHPLSSHLTLPGDMIE